MPADAGSVGAFRRGQLVYLDEPLDKVAADLRRSTGIDFSTSAAMSGRRFSGTLSIAEVKRDPRSLQPLLGVSLRQSGKGWIMGGRV
jgi:transmembrane sensor